MKNFRFIAWSGVAALCLTGALSSVTFADAPTTPDEMAPIASGTAGIVEGKIVEVEPDTLVIENMDGKKVRLPLVGKSGVSSKEFSKGEYIEAAITPEGITTSVRSVPSPNKQDLNPHIR